MEPVENKRSTPRLNSVFSTACASLFDSDSAAGGRRAGELTIIETIVSIMK
jgi:hypothetical protein